MARRRRSTAYHEAGHAVAHHFYRLAGKTTSVTIDTDDLEQHNAGKHPVNEAAGFISLGRRMPPIVGCAVDHEQIHHILITLLAGQAAGWIYCGEPQPRSKPDPQADQEARKLSDGTDDLSRVWNLLFDTKPFDARAMAKGVPESERTRLSQDDLRRRYVEPALNAHRERIHGEFKVLWREAVALVAEKWPHIQAIADALWRKQRLSGEEVTAIIERSEDRICRIPPSLEKQIRILRGDDARS